MAEAKKSQPKKKLVVKKKNETVREKASKSKAKAQKQPRAKKATAVAMKPVSATKKALTKEFNPIKTGESKAGQVLGKRRSIIPPYFVQSYRELKLVTWPTKKTAAKLTVAVFIFSVALMALVVAIDYGFEKLFREIILS